MRRLFLVLAAVLLPAAAAAEAPRVVTDIRPVEMLVARVMQGAGTPVRLVPDGADPHAFSLRPSQARALGDADVVVWTGPGLTPWLAGAIETLAGNARVLALSGEPAELERPEGDDHAGDDHDALHPWLDPAVAASWLPRIAVVLAEADPERAALYAANAAAGAAEIAAADAEAAARLAPLSGNAFVAGHDAWGPFAAHYGLTQLGAIADSEAAPPGAARLRALRAAIEASGTDCLVTDPRLSPGLVAAVFPEGARTVTIDPAAGDRPPGEDYPGFLRALAGRFADCLGGGAG